MRAFPFPPFVSLSLTDSCSAAAAAALRSARWRERSLNFLLCRLASRGPGAPTRASEAVADPSFSSGSLSPKFAGTLEVMPTLKSPWCGAARACGAPYWHTAAASSAFCSCIANS